MKRLIIAAVLLTSACTRIGPGHVGIKVSQAGDSRGVNEIPVTTGWVFYNPLGSYVFEWPTFVQQATLQGPEAITFNSEQMQIGADISYSYSLEASKVPAFYVKFRTDDLEQFSHGFLKNLIRDKFNEVASQTTIERIMTDNKGFLDEVKRRVQADVVEFGVHIENQFGIIGSPRLPQNVIDSINAKVQATQLAQQKQNELLQVQADMAKERAKAETYASNTLVAANAAAEANRKIAQSLTPELIEVKRLERWNGALPQVAGTANPFITLK